MDFIVGLSEILFGTRIILEERYKNLKENVGNSFENWIRCLKCSQKLCVLAVQQTQESNETRFSVVFLF